VRPYGKSEYEWWSRILIATSEQELQTALDRSKSYIIDMDGVIYRGDLCLPHVPGFLQALDDNNIPFLMATNNSTKSPDEFSDKLSRMGIELSADRILTSSVATRGMVEERYPKGTGVCVVGMNALHEAMFGDGYFERAGKDAEVVVSGGHFKLTYDELKIACLAIRAGADWFATNGDNTFPTEEGIIPGSGAIIAALEAATSKSPVVVGKPSTGMIDEALQSLGTTADETVMLGDRLDTDILAGERAGLITMLVMTGVTDLAELEAMDIDPDIIIDDLAPLVAYYTGRG
jgi:4-nitrophenyl phosphatase